MSDSREQFETWMMDNWPEQYLGRFATGEYQGLAAARWTAWEASRQALVVELPPIGIPSSAEDTWHNVRNNTIKACGRAIEAAGVRVKP